MIRVKKVMLSKKADNIIKVHITDKIKYYHMRTIILILIYLFTTVSSLLSQKPDEIYRKPLREVLADIEKRYEVRIEYSKGLINNEEVMYPTWRYRSDVEETIKSILYPFDLVFTRNNGNNFQVTRFIYYQRSPEEGKNHLARLLGSYPTVQDWERRKAELRKCILEKMNLSPLPRKTPLNPVYTGKRKMDGYTVENVAIETLPGVYLCGSLYRPLKGKGPFPAVLCTHGHADNPDPNRYGRYRPDHQYRCATLARMGAVVYSYEMFAWGESRLQFDASVHRTGLALTMQTWNSMRVIDFLTSLPYVDPKMIGVTGESGGGTQTFLLAALDDRVAVSVPVVMVSAYFFGGCPCESGLPIHSCSGQGTNNAEIAAMASPRPMLVISDGDDWTDHVPEIEFPYLQKVYGLYGKTGNVENVHLANEGHDYGLSKRTGMYGFMARHLGLNLNAAKDKGGNIDESKVTIETYDALLVFGKNGKLPENALKRPEEVIEKLKSLQ
jgi:dienelactone hydrolase